jgi:hypothetical protein
MTLASSDRRRLFRLVLFLISGVLAAFALGVSARAAGTRILVIPSEDGYGFEECLSTKSACGLIVADAWCEAHGLKASKSFGPAADVASTDDIRPANIKPGSFLVACGDSLK